MSHINEERYRDRIRLAAAFDEICSKTWKAKPIIPYHQHLDSAFEWFCRGADFIRSRGEEAQAPAEAGHPSGES